MAVSASVAKRITNRSDVNRVSDIGEIPVVREGYVDITFDDSYAVGGEAIAVTDIDEDFSELLELSQVSSEESADYEFRWDRANGKIKAFYKGWADKVKSGVITDDNSAASNGTDVLVGPCPVANGGPGAVLPDAQFLDSENAGNAIALARIASGGPYTLIDDNAGSTGGVALYFDEDATDPARRFLANITAARDGLLWLSDGSAIYIKYDATPDGEGVAVHFDDNAANDYERLLFVSPTDADGAFETYGQVAPATDLSGETIRFYFKAV